MGSRLEEKSKAVRKRIENHTFQGEDGEEYEGSKFGGFSDYFRRKKQKLQNLDAQIRSEAVDKPQIFRGVVCHVNGYTQPSLNDLHTLIVQHGGGFLQYLDGKTMVTHIIASNLTPKKKEEFRRYRIVKPAWVVDSVKAGKLLPWNEYRVLDEGVAQKVLGFDGGQVVSQVNRKTQGYREQTDASWYTSQLKSTAVDGKGKAAFKSTQAEAPPPAEDIDDDDEFGLPEITSSVEEALREAERSHSDHRSDDAIQTSPPTSPPAVPEAAVEVEIPEEITNEELKHETLHVPSEADQTSHSLESALLPRQGSQEPSYTHSLIRDSAILNSIPQAELAAMTAEQHNALLLSDPKIRASTVVNPAFLEQYYRESRLHHLSTWKADLKSQLQALAAQASSSQKASVKRRTDGRRYVMHVDFDSFFAAISLKKCPPEWKLLPAAVAHGGGSGSEIASCNYPARDHGVKNGMWMKRAQEMCPNLKVLPYDFPAYEDASRAFYAAILDLGGIVQSVSIDEALVDVSSLCSGDSGESRADELGSRVRAQVMEKTGCAVSVGIGGNILLAKLALRKAKPAGQYQLRPEDVLEFIGELEVQRLPGVAGSTGAKFEAIGVKLIKDLRAVSREMLCKTLGPKQGAKFYDYARGIDKTEVGDSVVRKSVSAEVNWGVRFETHQQVDEFMHGLCGELNRRLVKESVKGSLVTVKVMRRAKDAPLDPPKHLGHGKCDVFNKSKSLGVATHDPAVLAKEAIAMLKSFNISPGELRGIGVQMQKLEPIKLGAAGGDQGSQRRLQFNAGPAPPQENEDDTIQDDIKTPEKARVPTANRPSAAFRPIEPPSTPSKKLLNTMGTQFVMPTQVDPAVLAELPMDIRAKFAKQSAAQAKVSMFDNVAPKANSVTAAAPFAESQFLIPTQVDPAVLAELPAEIRAKLTRPNKINAPAADEKADALSRPHSPTAFLPTHSQIDPTILSALPEDVRNEILQHYKSVPSNPPSKRAEQALLPQSPRKARTLPPPRPVAKRGRGRPRGSLNLSRSSRESSSTLTQSNFIARPTRSAADEDETLDPEVLAALPEDLRTEVLAQQRQARLQRTGGIDTSLFQQKGAKAKAAAAAAGNLERHVVRLPPRAKQPVFTSSGLKVLGELRQAVSAWFKEFEDEGPHEEDVGSLATYLKAVVRDERDIGKAVKIVGWLAWVVEEGEGGQEWMDAVEVLKEAVGAAARERGLGDVKFG